MAVASLRINFAAIADKIDRAIKTKGQPFARKRAYDRFRAAKLRMLRQFNTHVVTTEIEKGGTIKTGAVLGYGNLFSFLGFNEGDQPTEAIRQKLEAYTYFINNPTYSRKAWTFKVNLPAIEFLKRNTALPWGGNGPSWITAVEKGLPNIIYYLNFKKRTSGSRSGYGLQSKHVVDDSRDFNGRPYLTEILNNFRETINNAGLVR